MTEKLYKLDLDGFGTIITDADTIGKLKDVFLDAAISSSNMIDYCVDRNTAEFFRKEYDERMAIVEMLWTDFE